MGATKGNREYNATPHWPVYGNMRALRRLWFRIRDNRFGTADCVQGKVLHSVRCCTSSPFLLVLPYCP